MGCRRVRVAQMWLVTNTVADALSRMPDNKDMVVRQVLTVMSDEVMLAEIREEYKIYPYMI